MTPEKTFHRLPEMFLALLLGFSMVYALTSSLLLTFPALYIFVLLAVFIAVCSLVFRSRLTLMVSGIVIALLVIATVVVAAFTAGFYKLFGFIEDYFYWLADFINETIGINKQYQAITVIVLCIFISIFVYIFTVKRYTFLILLAAGVSIFVVQWSYNFMATFLPFYIFLLAILMAYFKHIHNQKSKSATNEYTNSGTYTFWVIPLCIIVILFASILNFNEKPIEWKWLDSKINSVYKFFNRQFDYQAFDYFSLSSSGFGGRDNFLGGRVRLDNTYVLKVQTPRNVYLKGAVRDVYTGTGWNNSDKNNIQIGRNYGNLTEDTFEMLGGLRLLSGQSAFVTKYFYTDKVEVTFQNLKTKSLFVPSKLISITPASNAPNVVTDSNGSIFATGRLNKGFKYTMQLYSPKLGTKDFEDLLRKSHRGFYFLNTSVDPEAASLMQRSDQVYSKYLQLPENLPQRVRDLSASLTSQASNDYDKVKAIEKYLVSNYAYNLDVPSTPRNRDFVDYFLFDLNQGYCSYYASAMTVLVRASGIPARYVEGYILPPKPTEKDKTIYNVTNMQAHAWTEVYFEGYGWLPFEPTAPFTSNFYADTSETATLSSEFSGYYGDYMEMVRRYGHHDSEDDLDFSDAETAKTPHALIATVSVALFVLLFLVLVSFNLVKSRLRLYRMFNSEPRRCILNLYAYFLEVLAIQDLKLNPGETPGEYSKRIDRYMFFSPMKFKAITDIFVKCRYSTNPVSEKEKLALCDFQRSFNSETRENMGKFRFFFQKCILGKI